jgi:hypothetical protein
MHSITIACVQNGRKLWNCGRQQKAWEGRSAEDAAESNTPPPLKRLKCMQVSCNFHRNQLLLGLVAFQVSTLVNNEVVPTLLRHYYYNNPVPEHYESLV